MTDEQRMHQIDRILAHAWMVRTFLKHAEEIEDDIEMLEVHRAIFDYVRALEPSFERGDAKTYLRRAKAKFPKLKKASDFFATEYRRITDHTNFEMAAKSLAVCVEEIDKVVSTPLS